MIEDVSPAQAWEALLADPNARLVDVRTEAEWQHIGLPDLSPAGKEAILIQWQVAPAMRINPTFIKDLMAAGLSPEHHIYFICRSGVRSLAAAEAAREAGLPNAYNVADGFEGPPDHQGQRGTVAGWQASELPWRHR
jgi:rhodanese-related sulfurtransferase